MEGRVPYTGRPGTRVVGHWVPGQHTSACRVVARAERPCAPNLPILRRYVQHLPTLTRGQALSEKRVAGVCPGRDRPATARAAGSACIDRVPTYDRGMTEPFLDRPAAGVINDPNFDRFRRAFRAATMPGPDISLVVERFRASDGTVRDVLEEMFEQYPRVDPLNVILEDIERVGSQDDEARDHQARGRTPATPASSRSVARIHGRPRSGCSLTAARSASGRPFSPAFPRLRDRSSSWSSTE